MKKILFLNLILLFMGAIFFFSPRGVEASAMGGLNINVKYASGTNASGIPVKAVTNDVWTTFGVGDGSTRSCSNYAFNVDGPNAGDSYGSAEGSGGTDANGNWGFAGYDIGTYNIWGLACPCFNTLYAGRVWVWAPPGYTVRSATHYPPLDNGWAAYYLDGYNWHNSYNTVNITLDPIYTRGGVWDLQCDATTGNRVVASGWSCDPYNVSTTNPVHLYIDGSGPPSRGVNVDGDSVEEEVGLYYAPLDGALCATHPLTCGLCGGRPNHRFKYTFPVGDAINSGSHSIYAWSQPVSGSPNTHIGLGWKSVTCPVAVVNGACNAPPHGTASATAPSGSSAYFCSTGTASAVSSGTNSWTWTCAGSGGGTTASCAVNKTYDLTVTRSGTGTGTVVDNIAPIKTYVNNPTPTSGVRTFNSGTSVTLTATPSTGSRFANWSGCSTSTNASITVSMGAATTCNAVFNARYDLYVIKAGTGNGMTIDNDGATFPNGGGKTYDSGFGVILTATPDVGSYFGGFSGDCSAATGTQSTNTLIMSSNKTCTVTFNSIPTIDLTLTANGVYPTAPAIISGNTATIVGTPTGNPDWCSRTSSPSSTSWNGSAMPGATVSKTDSPTMATTYTMHCEKYYGIDGESVADVTKSVTVPVTAALTCDISFSRNPVIQLFPTELSWSHNKSGQPVTIVIDNGVGTLNSGVTKTIRNRNIGPVLYTGVASLSGYPDATCTKTLTVNPNTDTSGGTQAP